MDKSAAQGQLGPDFHQRDEDNIDASREPAAASSDSMDDRLDRALEDVDAGRVESFDNDEDFLASLDESPAAITPWPSAESSAARPCGTCWRCGGTLYEYLTHGCTTSVRMVQNVQGSIRLTPWGTWEWRPW